MHKIFASKWGKAILAGLSVMAIASISSAGTYFYILRNPQNEKTGATQTEGTSIGGTSTGGTSTGGTSTGGTGTGGTSTGGTTADGTQIMESLEDNADDAENKETAFSKIVENLKQQASESILLLFPERREAINAVGTALKDILASEYATLLNNNTFHDDAFSVTITTYPLRENRYLERIKYVIKGSGDNGTAQENHYFLRYVGATSIFSDIEEISPFGEQAFQVFENKEGCFVFSILRSSGQEAFSVNTEYYTYFGTVFSLEDNGFISQKIEIPFMVPSGYSIQLTLQDEIIKASRTDIANNPECVFNSSTLTFEIARKPWVSEPIAYDLPAVLLGLSDSKGNIRTLFIRKEGDKICANEYANQIIFQRKKQLFSLKQFEWADALYEDEFGNTLEYPLGRTNLRKLLCAPLGVDITADFEKNIDKPMYVFRSSTDIPLYVGEDYVCYIQDSYFSGGGSYHELSSNIRFGKLENLSKFHYNYDFLIPDFEETTLADLIYGNKVKDFYQSDFQTYGGELNPYVDFRQLSIKRNLGKWSFMLPVMSEYYHPGNGSYSSWVNNFAAFSNDVPAFIASNDEAMNLSDIGTIWAYWLAKDLVAFPESDAYLGQYDYIIGIGNRNDGDYIGESIDLKIPVSLDEYIVSISFADAGIQESWLSELSAIEEP